MKKDFFKENKIVIIVFAALTCLFIYSSINVCTYLFGEKRELYVTLDNHFQLDYSQNYVWYNNGKKMVKERVHLSFIESAQWRKNSGYITFKQLGTHLTHRSAFVYSAIYSILFISFSTWFIISVINKKKKDKLQRNEKQVSLNV